jgi:hypothetical protein
MDILFRPLLAVFFRVSSCARTRARVTLASPCYSERLPEHGHRRGAGGGDACHVAIEKSVKKKNAKENAL